MGGQPETPQPAAAQAAPSTAEAVNAWVASLPAVYQAQLDYAPKEAAQQVALAQQYAAPMGEAMLSAQNAMYPETTALQENLAVQAKEGMQSQMPEWYKDQYLSNFRANLGTNIGAPVAAADTSRGLLQQQKDWGDYYRNMALSVTGRQPLTQASTPQTSNWMQGYTPNSVMNYTQQGYGTQMQNQASIYGSQMGYAGQMGASNNQMFGQIMGSALGGAGSALGGFGMGLSSIRYKKNIKLWA
jgi:hypothetical protein